MKIAYIYDGIYPYIKGGAEKRFWDLATRLARKGHEVHIFGRDPGIGRSNFVKEGVHIHAVSAHLAMYSSQGKRSIKQVFRFSLGILPHLWWHKFDVIDTNAFAYLHFPFVKFYCFCRKIPLAVTWQEIWGSYWYGYLGLIKGLVGRLAEKNAILLSKNNIFYTSFVKERFFKYGGSGRKTVLIPNGIDLDLINQVKTSEEVSDLIFTGRLLGHKQVDLFIKSFLWVRKKFPEVKGVIIGEGPEKDKLVRLARELGLEQSLFFKDFMLYEQMISFLKSSRIFVFPSEREGFGISVIEAMACGLVPVTVSAALNASQELVEDGRTGFVCAPDEKEIADRIITLLEDRNKMGEMAAAARDYAQRFDWDRVVGMNESFYLDLIKEKQ